MRISEHYTTLDVSFDLVAVKNKINNTPPREAILAAEKLAVNLLEPMRQEFDFRIVSWYRSPVLEREYTKGSFYNWIMAQGKPFNDASWAQYLGEKQHVLGSAVSLISNEATSVYEWLQTQTFDVLQMRDSYIHVSWVEQANRKIVLK